MTTPTPSGADIARQWLGASPFVKYLSIELVALEPGIATLRLPYDQTMTTIGSVVHGGAIVTLMDSAGAAAAWAGAEVPANIRRSSNRAIGTPQIFCKFINQGCQAVY